MYSKHDVPAAPFEAPLGFAIAEAPPPEEQLAFSKEAEAPADALVGRSVLFKWPAIGWCIAKITERNVDARVYKKIEDQRVKVNFWLFFEIDQQTIKTCLRLEEYGGDDDFAWVLLDELV